ncbi:peptidylprolyl isomerase [Stieleria maiorica]|uniref:Periplasmic chaperone PpiD n=1 Tax=Stieleria maiorica TaxID=2795974 RepID=A0A5B9MPH2_9BACT|nr:peptidyl-prolyl cis-trans isomerase [Stieleria maiorica]QEG01887.1 peptidylprolyl isomerase [Stieleria maiorica]
MSFFQITSRTQSASPRPVLRLLSAALLISVSIQSPSTLHGQVPALPVDLAPLPDDPATVMAVVGQSPILWGDIQPKVDGRINQVLEEKNLQLPPEQLAPARMNLARGALTQAIQTKMMSESFLLEQVGTQAAEKRREVSEMMTSRARQMFFENELQGLKEKYGTEDLTELDAKLRETGTSLRARQREFTDMMLGHMYMRSKIEKDPPVTIAEINAAYQHDLDSYRHKAKARWEQLSVLFANHPSREAARALIGEMGREVWYNEGWKETARQKSEEPFAADGGQHDWTSEGSLASKPIEQQLFSIPLDKMSEIIEDDQGLHIIRVLERKEAGVTPLAEVQDDIREKIKQEKIAASQAKMMREMQKQVPVWSMYPEDMPGAKPLRPTSIATGPTNDADYR